MPKHKVIPPEFRERYKNEASAVYDSIAGDIMNLDDGSGKPIKMSERGWIEVIRDANRILEYARNYCTRISKPTVLTEAQQKTVDDRKAFIEWLTVNEYNPEFSRDMNRAVKEIL